MKRQRNYVRNNARLNVSDIVLMFIKNRAGSTGVGTSTTKSNGRSYTTEWWSNCGVNVWTVYQDNVLDCCGISHNLGAARDDALRVVRNLRAKA
tara:strand:- start:11526 stop:11807 length:282 start_codon:yes stop_codon:yes gene_type:complete